MSRVIFILLTTIPFIEMTKGVFLALLFDKMIIMSKKISKKHPTFISTIIVYAIVVSAILVFRNAHADEIDSTNFTIRGDTVSSGSSTGTTSNYGLIGDINPFSDLSASNSFKQEVGYSPRIQANTPYAATLQNDQEYYDRLLIIIDESDNPSDTVFAVAISDDNFQTQEYIQNDGTVSAVLGTEDYRTYVSWGEGTGSFILVLNQNTDYKVRVKALNGDFTETGYSPDSNEVSTTVPYVNMGVTVSALSFGVMNINSVSQTSTTAVVVNSNAYTGYQVYVSDKGDDANGGLYNGVSSLIESNDGTLISGFEGYGVQASSLTADIDASFDVSGDNIGGLDISSTGLFSNTAAVIGESTNVLFKATMSPNTVAGNYTDIVYFTVTPNL